MQATLIDVLLLPKDDQRWTSCVRVHGMGGTGKTVRETRFEFVLM